MNEQIPVSFNFSQESCGEVASQTTPSTLNIHAHTQGIRFCFVSRSSEDHAYPRSGQVRRNTRRRARRVHEESKAPGQQGPSLREFSTRSPNAKTAASPLSSALECRLAVVPTGVTTARPACFKQRRGDQSTTSKKQEEHDAIPPHSPLGA